MKQRHSPMPTHNVDHAKLSKMVETGCINATHIVGQAGGWAIQVSARDQEHILTAQRSGNVRLFKKLETLVSYLQALGIDYFKVDTSGYNPETLQTYQRPDRAQALKTAHEAAAYDAWFNAQVEASLQDPAPSIEDDEARRLFAARRTTLKSQ
ncbi:hypothetical protein [Pseudomonas rubra]|uniref:Stability determinant domain-containing protein n=1 Tax=Pseudomonas rubra TaxID=2942627 RepID=A0ABT5P283_9PSED|nr:hypothetical protein [Pseudomonas rubra]MDD1012376.1 hypothetical protein [Pseudomonas rubra]MDD1037277.1 hypothetical protein [Pseudomonas rubra]MDD1152994.1 hypothetical protein [Pseudomonas rubra]